MSGFSQGFYPQIKGLVAHSPAAFGAVDAAFFDLGHGVAVGAVRDFVFAFGLLDCRSASARDLFCFRGFGGLGYGGR